MKKMLILFSLILCLMIFSVVPASADNNNTSTRYRANATVDNNDFDWGWLGLLGLAGLIGMRSRESDRDRA